MAKILIVDDSLYARKMLSDILIKEGHQIIGEAENAKEAVKLYRKLKPDVVTMDIIMPDVDRINAVQAVKEIVSEDLNANILIVTAMGQQDIAVEYIQAGAKGFIVKPYQPSVVTNEIKRLVEK